MTDRINRRRLLAGTAAALASPVAAVPTLAGAAPPHPDEVLLDLGREFDAVHLEWTDRRPVYDAANEAWSAALQNLHRTKGSEPVPDQVYFDLFAEADPDGVIAQENALFLRLDTLGEAILAHPAATVDRLGVKARARPSPASGTPGTRRTRKTSTGPTRCCAAS